jgi:hypothetical protein
MDELGLDVEHAITRQTAIGELERSTGGPQITVGQPFAGWLGWRCPLAHRTRIVRLPTGLQEAPST